MNKILSVQTGEIKDIKVQIMEQMIINSHRNLHLQKVK